MKVVREWLGSRVECRDDAFVQLLALAELRSRAVDRIQRAIVRSAPTRSQVLPVLRSFDPVGSTHVVDFDTSRHTLRTRDDKSHVSHVVADTASWEQQVAYALESMDEVTAYVKNDHLGFTIPYTIDAQIKRYVPDFLVRIDDGGSEALTLVVEVSGQAREDKTIKVATATRMWVPAVNTHGGFGKWAFCEVTDPTSTKATIRAAVADVLQEG